MMKPFEPVSLGRYTVTPYPAIHDPGAGPLFYGISDGERAVLYAHDTHYFREDVWENWKETRPHFDLVSLDCTNACLPLTYVGHMGLKENAEAILSRLGVTPSGAIQMLYSQIVLRQGLPFDLYLPRNDPAAIGGMSRTELDEELKKGVNSLRSGSYTADEIDAVLAEEFGL